MRQPQRTLTAAATVAALLVLTFPGAAMADGSGRLEGLVVEVDGRPAPGYRVHLIDDGGDVRASAVAGDDGTYSFPDVPAGDYALGIENLEGQVAPLVGPAVSLDEGQLARRDVKLMSADAQTRNAALGANYGVGLWWAGLSPAAKVWTVVAIVAVTAITVAAFDSSDSEPPASAIEP